jgi:hypothetical protein
VVLPSPGSPSAVIFPLAPLRERATSPSASASQVGLACKKSSTLNYQPGKILGCVWVLPEVGQHPQFFGRLAVEEHTAVRFASEPRHIDRRLLVPPVAALHAGESAVVADPHPLAGADHERLAGWGYLPPGGAYFVSQANTSLCQWTLFFGFSTQWPSSGKLTNRLGTFCLCNALNSSCPWPMGQRKS